MGTLTNKETNETAAYSVSSGYGVQLAGAGLGYEVSLEPVRDLSAQIAGNVMPNVAVLVPAQEAGHADQPAV